jgi:hypothetical protein
MKCDCINPTEGMSAEIIFTAGILKARKQHICCECGKAIEKGEKYCYEDGKWWDGKITTYKTCLDCLSIREAMFCGTWTYKYIWEDVRNYLESVDYEISEKCLLALTPCARGKVLDMIDAAWAKKEIENGQ